MKIENITREEVLCDLTDKVGEQMMLYFEKIPEMVKRLDDAHSGVVDDHAESMENGKPYETANKVILAVLRQMQYEAEPPKTLNTKEFRAYVDNLFKLL